MTNPKPPIKCWATTNSVMIDPQGHVRPCCKFEDHFGHIDEYDSIDSILNSDQYKLLRKRHSYGNITQACWRCRDSEARGYKSRRQSYETRFTDNDFQLDISPGLYCNLKCRMCGPYNSTSWFGDWEKLAEMKIVNRFREPGINVYSMPDYDIDKIIQFISKSDANFDIELKGGEPLMTPATKNLFERLSAHGNRIHLNMITNGTYTPNWLPNSLKSFKKVTIGISADGVDSMYNYIRGDNKKYTWERFLKNVEWYKNMAKALPIKLKFNFTVQNTNIHQLHKFSEAIEPANTTWIIVNNPAFLTTKVIPNQAKEFILSELGPWIDKIKDHYQYEDLKKIVDELTTNHKVDKELYKQYIIYNAGLDKLRDQSLLEVAPHMVTRRGRIIYDSV